jgi:hypothetical protein
MTIFISGLRNYYALFAGSNVHDGRFQEELWRELQEKTWMVFSGNGYIPGDTLS